MTPVSKPILMILIGSVSLASTGAEIPPYAATTVELPRDHWGWFQAIWQDIDLDSRDDLLILLAGEQSLRIYRQQATEIPAQPSQTLALPEGTAWVRLADVDSHPGLELLLSQPHGFDYHLQDQGVFRPDRERLLESPQTFDMDVVPRFARDDPQSPPRSFPVVEGEHIQLYHIDPNYRCRPLGMVSLAARSTMRQAEWPEWNLGYERAVGIYLRTKYSETDEKDEVDKPEDNPAVRRKIDTIRKDRHWSEYGIERQDLNADDRQDLVLWQCAGIHPAKTTVVVYLRNKNGKLPDQPNQVLRCKGVPTNRKKTGRGFSVLRDLDQDGLPEIILLSIQTNITSWSQIVDTIISQGMEWHLTVRAFAPGRGYDRSARAKVPLTCTPHDWLPHLLFWDGDLNGDGRKDLVVKRSSTVYEIFPAVDSGYFASTPAGQVLIESEGSLSLSDLNHDGQADWVVEDQEELRIHIHLSQPTRKQGADL